jgi:hypothetical protein
MAGSVGSPQLKQMQRSLRSLSAETGQFHKTSITQSKAHTAAFDDLRKSVTDVGDRVHGVLTPSLAAKGVSAHNFIVCVGHTICWGSPGGGY